MAEDGENGERDKTDREGADAGQRRGAMPSRALDHDEAADDLKPRPASHDYDDYDFWGHHHHPAPNDRRSPC